MTHVTLPCHQILHGICQIYLSAYSIYSYVFLIATKMNIYARISMKHTTECLPHMLASVYFYTASVLNAVYVFQCFHRYRNAQILLHSLAQQARDDHDRQLLNKCKWLGVIWVGGGTIRWLLGDYGPYAMG